jgi:4'-phosphopantetheinyl transferase
MSGGAPNVETRRWFARLESEAHLWLLRLRESISPTLERRWRELLSAEEREAERRFRVESARRQFLAARALVRTTLSRYTEIDPRRWEFEAGEHGKPEIAAPIGAPPLRFNLSHTRGLVGCVVTLGLDAGIDVERPERRLGDPLALARRGFAPAERRALEALRGGARRRLFFDLWTLKEAYVKARGAGFLALPARQLACEIDGDGVIRVSFEPELEDQPDAWQLALLAPTGEHRLAVAVRRGERHDLTLVSHEVEPFGTPPRRVAPAVVGRSPASTARVSS